LTLTSGGLLFSAANDETITGSTIAPGTGAYHPKLCFVEIGPLNGTIDSATMAKLAALITQANNQTGASPDPVNKKREYAYGTYVDEVLGYTQSINGGTATRYFVHSNHLYSTAALTSGNAGDLGQVVGPAAQLLDRDDVTVPCGQPVAEAPTHRGPDPVRVERGDPDHSPEPTCSRASPHLRDADRLSLLRRIPAVRARSGTPDPAP